MRKCWLCRAGDVIYTDVIGMPWCRACFYEVYLERKPADGGKQPQEEA